MRTRAVAGVFAILLVTCWPLASEPSRPTVIPVGPDREIKLPSQAAEIAVDGAIVEIDAGIYPRDSAVWRQNDLTLRGVGGLAYLRSEGKTSDGKAIWVIKGSNTRVENIEFSGARVKDENGAGIRQEGQGLTVVGCSFHDNQNGILSGNRPESDIVIERSEFHNNGFGDGRTHNMYIGRAKSLTLRHNYIHHAKAGHNVKTRASANYILYNRIMDEADGTASYAIDLPDGGVAYVVGNLLQQGPNTDNSNALVTFGVESLPVGRTHALYLVNNTLVNDFAGGGFVTGEGGAQTLSIVNNIFAGSGTAPSGAGVTNNLVSDDPALVDRAGYDYRLAGNSPARDAGIDPGSGMGFGLTPVYQYLHPRSLENRPRDAVLDIGAYEYSN